MKTLTLIVSLLFLLISPAHAADVYKWVDKNGVVNFTDDYNKIPSAYRDRVEVEIREEIKTPGTPGSPTPGITGTPIPRAPGPPRGASSPQPPPQKGEEITTDINGHGEAWWRERVKPWRERLKEATEKYEVANKIFLEKSQELSRRQQGTRTEFRGKLKELDKLDEERKRHRAEVAEAEEMLKKFSREAEEAKADPDWLE
jgi:hypothetical protein